MGRTKVINPNNVLKDHSRILRGLEDWVRGIDVDVLSRIEEKLSSDLPAGDRLRGAWPPSLRTQKTLNFA